MEWSVLLPGYKQRILTCFERGSNTVQLTSTWYNLITYLDSTEKVNLLVIFHEVLQLNPKQTNWGSTVHLYFHYEVGKYSLEQVLMEVVMWPFPHRKCWRDLFTHAFSGFELHLNRLLFQARLMTSPTSAWSSTHLVRQVSPSTRRTGGTPRPLMTIPTKTGEGQFNKYRLDS